MNFIYGNGGRRRRPGTAAAAAALALLAVSGGCGGSEKPSSVKSASAYRADLYAITEDINRYLMENTPADTSRDELHRFVGAGAHKYTKLAAEAGPFRGKTGDAGYGLVAAQAEDGVIVAGNLAAALAADPAKHAGAASRLAAAVEDWVEFNDELGRRASAEVPFEPRRWWETPVWRRAAGGEA